VQQRTHWEYTDEEDRCTESGFSGNNLNNDFLVKEEKSVHSGTSVPEVLKIS